MHDLKTIIVLVLLGILMARILLDILINIISAALSEYQNTTYNHVINNIFIFYLFLNLY